MTLRGQSYSGVKKHVTKPLESEGQKGSGNVDISDPGPET